MKKILAITLSASMMTCLLAGCSNSSSSSASSNSASSSSSESSETVAKVTYPLEGNKKLTLIAAENTYVLNSYSTWNETPFIQAWSEQTGVEVKASFVTDFSVYLAAGDYADIIVYSWNSYNGGANKAIADGIIIPIEEYIEEYAPDYSAILDSNEDYRKGVVTSSGHIYGFNNLRTEAALNSWGMFLRSDWMKTLGREIPVTLDEFTDTLKAFRDELGATSPLSVPLSDLKNIGVNGVLTSPFGLVSVDFYQKDGKVHYGSSEQEYKDYLLYLNELYNDGLLDKNILTNDANITKSNLMNDISGVSVGYASGGLGTIMTQMASVNPAFDLKPVGSLVAKKGDTAMMGQNSGYVAPTAAAISTSCKDIETAIKFLNYGYSEPGNLLMYYGIEGESYEMVNNYPTYTDFVKKNPNGLSFPQALSLYDYSPANGPFVSNGDYSRQTYTETQLSALDLWVGNDWKNYFIPTGSISISDENADDYSSIKSEVDTCVNEYFAKFVTGEYSIEKDFDSYLSTLKSMGIDTMIQMYQEAYDEYMSH